MQAHPASKAATTSPAQTGEAVLRTYDLTKYYGERVAVNQLNLEVRRGEIVGFLGPNGAGKTTSIRMILGLIAPTAGRVEIFGRNLATERASLLPRIGALVETPALYLHLTGRENLRAVGAILGGVSRQRIESVLEQVGLQARQKDRVRTYSLGMKQRLGVGIALLNDPDLLILDEPANGLDPAGIVEMRDLMHRLAAEGKTVFLSSHFLGEVQQICSRVVFLNAGKLVADKTVAELTRGQGEYAVQLERVQEALALVPALRPGYLAGAAIEDDAFDMDVAAIHQGFLRMLNANRGILALRSRAGRIERRGDIWEIETTGGITFRAPILVNAAGAWGDEIAERAGAVSLGRRPCRRTAAIIDPNPYDVADIARALERLDTDTGLRADLTELGVAQAGKFSAENYRKRLTELYDSVL